eukprot:scaffold33455_cov112-Isochrysis_galbana.AAC.1
MGTLQSSSGGDAHRRMRLVMWSMCSHPPPTSRLEKRLLPASGAGPAGWSWSSRTNSCASRWHRSSAPSSQATRYGSASRGSSQPPSHQSSRTEPATHATCPSHDSPRQATRSPTLNRSGRRALALPGATQSRDSTALRKQHSGRTTESSS